MRDLASDALAVVAITTLALGALALLGSLALATEPCWDSSPMTPDGEPKRSSSALAPEFPQLS